MARKPVYGQNKGLARTTVNGNRVYLGEYNSPESKAAFEKIISDWEAAHAERMPSVSLELTVSRLVVLFLRHAEIEYCRDGVPTGEAKNFRHALQSMNNLFHGFGLSTLDPRS